MTSFQFLLDRAEYPDFLAWARDHVVPDSAPLEYKPICWAYLTHVGCMCDDPRPKYVAKCMAWLGVSKAKHKQQVWYCRIV